MNFKTAHRVVTAFVAKLEAFCMLAAVAIMMTGCGWLRSEKSTPAGSYMFPDDVQYFPAGAEHQLSREEAALRAARAAEKAARNETVSNDVERITPR